MTEQTFGVKFVTIINAKIPKIASTDKISQLFWEIKRSPSQTRLCGKTSFLGW